MSLHEKYIKQLAEKRDKLGWSNYKLSKESGVPGSTISRIFDGSIPKLHTFLALSKALGIEWKKK